MKRALAAGLLSGGLILLYFGYQEYNSFPSEVNQLFGGAGSEKGIWMMAGGAAACIAGLAGLLRGGR